MKKTCLLLIATACVLAIALSLAAFTLLNNTPSNESSQNPKQTSTPTNPSYVNTPTATSSNDYDYQPTFHGVPVYSYQVIQSYPHDTSAFTQGLTFDDDYLIEGTGLNGASSIRRVNLVDGQVLQKSELSSEYFGEGLTVVDDKIVQLTWKNEVGFIYDKDTFELLGNFSLSTEGWGLTYDGNCLIVSDGTANLYFLDSVTYQIVNSLTVYDAVGSVKNLNELEYINGYVYANVWFSSKIAIINPVTGQVTAYIDLDDLVQMYTSKNSDAVLNGIAYNSKTEQLYVTGKFWSNIYEIQI
jgi:glutamine cyclotransferase